MNIGQERNIVMHAYQENNS